MLFTFVWFSKKMEIHVIMWDANGNAHIYYTPCSATIRFLTRVNTHYDVLQYIREWVSNTTRSIIHVVVDQSLSSKSYLVMYHQSLSSKYDHGYVAAFMVETLNTYSNRSHTIYWMLGHINVCFRCFLPLGIISLCITTDETWDPCYEYDFILVTAWISSNMTNKVWDEITQLKFENGYMILSHIIMYFIIHLCWNLS